MIGTGRMAVLTRWLSDVDDDRLTGDGGLALVSGWLAAQSGDEQAMDRYVLAAEACAARQPRYAGDVKLLKATIAADGLDVMRSLAEKYIATASPDDPWLSVGHFLRGICLLLTDEPNAEAELLRAHRISTVHQLPAMRARCAAALAEVYMMHNDHDRAGAHVREAREIVAAHRLEHLVTIAPVLVTSARCYVQDGARREASREAAAALRLLSLMPVLGPLGKIYNRLSLADVYLALGDQERATILLAEAERAYGPTTRSPMGDRLLAGTQHLLREARTSPGGAHSLTTAEIRVLQYLPTHLSFPEIAAELFVSRHTVKTQVLSAYRKLDAHGRSEAVAKARQAGLLPSP
jgi:LuxR family transcriptional regulator, maltose regulon positive regulatory protein